MVPHLDIARYDRIALCMSGGKDSLAWLLHLLELGVAPDRIELHHQDVDGAGPCFMDWPCTLAYVRAIADHFGIALYRSWREGGFLAELQRDATPSGRVHFETPTGPGSAGGRGPAGTRGRFPQLSANLAVRWCSAALKIDVFAATIRNQPRFLDGATLVVTGERAEESRNRARYAVLETHRTRSRARHVDHWRPVHGWTAAQVWAIVERWRIRPHPAYALGWGRLSCRCCIFGSADQWATIARLFPDCFARLVEAERVSGQTIRRLHSIQALADRGTPFAAAEDSPALVAQAQDRVWHLPISMRPWRMPAGAIGDQNGPS